MIRLLNEEYYGMDDDLYTKRDLSKRPEPKLYDVVSYAGYDWYVIDSDRDTITLLIKDNVFERHIFDQESNDYKTSDIRKYLNSEILPKLKSRGVNPLPIYMSDVTVTDQIGLLSVEEAKKLPRDIRKFSRLWWLRSRGDIDIDAADVSADGDVYDYGDLVSIDGLAVRPAIRVRLEELEQD